MVWDDIFKSREWGKFPPEDLIRIATNFVKNQKSNNLNCLEIGSGPGANALFLSDLFSTYAAIDISETAIKLLQKRIEKKSIIKELEVGCFSSLPWNDKRFDFICDNFSIYANKISVINSCLCEVERVMTEKAIFYSRVWGMNCYGIDSGKMIEKNTYDNLKLGPCAGYGVSHFFDMEEIFEIYGNFFQINSVKKLNNCLIYEDGKSKKQIEEFIILAELK